MHYPIPIHLQEPFREFGYHAGDLPVTEEVARTELSLPMFAELNDAQVRRVVDAVRSFRPH